MSIEALIFDLDGTLADTEEGHRVAFNLAFERYRLGWNWSRDQYRVLLRTTGGKERLGTYIDQLMLSSAEHNRLSALLPAIHAEKTKFYSSVVNDGAIPLRCGVARLLEEAQVAGCRLALASSTTAVNVDALLHSTLGARGLDMFSVIVCGDQVRAKKPAPEIYKKALRQLDLLPHRAVAFEDSTNGLRAALGAGLWTVVTPTYWSEGGDFSAAGLVLRDLGDPAHPLQGEPGRELRSTPWLTFAELQERAPPMRPGLATQVPH